MNYKIKNYVDKLFADKPNEPSVNDIKEELLANLNDKFNDLINDGKSLEEAYLLVISGIGEIDELLKPPQVHRDDYFPVVKTNKIGEQLKPTQVRHSDDIPIVKADKDGNRQSEKTDETKKKTKYEVKKIIPLIWLSVTVAFFIISFPTDWWSVTWVLFPLGSFLTLLTLYFLSEPKKKSYFYGMFWTGIVTFYLFINVFFEKVLWINIWSWTWLIFPIAVVAQYVVIDIIKNKK